LISVSTLASAQNKTDTINGKYYGENLYIFNPSVNDTAFCIKSIVVNFDTVTEQLESNAIELDFSTMNLEQKEDITILISFDSVCSYILVNFEALLPPNPFKFSSPKIRDNTIQFYIYGTPSDYDYEVQQFKWGKWETVNEVNPLDTIRPRYYEAEVMLHSGDNKFRLFTTNLKGEEVYSRESTYRPPYLKQVELESERVKEEIVFSRETEFRLFDENNIMIKSGVQRYVDVKDLERGKYWLKFDNQTIQIKKR
jgi:hypothetical protein